MVRFVLVLSLIEFLSRAQFDSPAFRASVDFFQDSTEDRVNNRRVINAVVNFYRMVVHLRTTIRTKQFVS